MKSLNIFLLHNNKTQIKKVYDYFVNKSHNVTIKNLAEDMENFSIEEIINFQEKLLGNMTKADAILCEVSNNKEHLALVKNAASKSGTPLFIIETGESTEIKAINKRALKSYECRYVIDEIESFGKQFIGRMNKLVQRKFIFNIDPASFSYLEWKSAQEDQCPKAEILREVLDSKISADVEYQKFL
jgi:hypothetical protein